MDFKTVLVLFGAICYLGIAVSAEPWIPEGRLNDPNWVNAHNSFVERTQNSNGNIKIVFLGASITNWWPAHIWNQHYEPLGAVNYGLSGDGTANALWRIQNGEIDGIADSVKLVAYADCGSNDVGGGWGGDDISRGTRALVDTIREKLPNARILLLGLMPRDNGNADRNSRLIDTNIKNSKIDTGASDSVVKYLDIWAQFAQGWLTVEQSLFLDDQLHLTDAGYEKWAQTIDPLVISLSQS